jgi:NhaP-type Na+/H+ or K+/H+ antiporter/mannitol/fructose-specific phosphotransferase system IIA component (Ntr-type)
MPILAIAGTQDALWALCLAIGAGCLLTALSRKLHLPTIVLLLLGGFLLGSEGIGILNPNALGDFLPMIVSMAVALILFEGGLTLNLKGFLQTSTVIKRLLSAGVLITWLGSALTVYLVFRVTPSFALLMGSLIIVTGPTVIVPLLRRIRIDQKVGSILHWEAVLIDSIGVFIAILCFEWVVEGGGAVALPNFLIRIISGASIGLIGGYIIYWLMKRNWVPDDIVNGFTLASALLIFGVTELIKPEAGLLSVTVAGLIVGLKKPRQIKEIKAFKAEIVDLLIGLLFLILVARLEIQQFIDFFKAGGGLVLFAVILMIRPISVLVSSWGTSLNLRERALLSWVAPRGVVAASMASLFALSLQLKGHNESAALMESFVYSIICATVLIQGLSAGVVASILGLQRPAPNDLVIIGAHHFGRELAKRLTHENEQRVILLDANASNVKLACDENLVALCCDALEAESIYEEKQPLFGAGQILALTDNIELNQLLMERWADVLDNEKVFGWIPSNYFGKKDQLTGQPVFGNVERPTKIGNALLQEESSLELVVWKEGKKLPSGDWHPLYIRRGKSLKAIPNDAALKELARNNDEIICLHSSEGFLLRAIQKGGYTNITCNNLEDLYEQLAQIADTALDDMPKAEILESIGAKGNVFPTYLGHGIAIPNFHSADLDQRICFVVSLSKSLPIPGENEKIDCIFLLLSPFGDTEGHLATLSDISMCCRSARRRKLIKNANKVEDLIAAVS